MLTDGAATSATGASPVFSSASYNFVAGDVGAWVFIASGTNWTPGWYKIASVAANAATLSAAIGAAVKGSGATTSAIVPNTVAGCATTASPTGATWSIDYSQQAAAQFAYTDLASAGAGLTVSSAAKPFAKQHVGNSLVITGGTNFTTGRYVIASVAAAVATVVGAANITTGAGASGTGGQGGALASPGQVGAHVVATNRIFIKTGTYTVTSASTNIAVGCLASALATIEIEGYSSVRGDLLPLAAAGTRPTIIASGISTFTLISLTGASGVGVRNLILDGASLTSSKALVGSNGIGTNLLFKNCTNAGVTGNISLSRCAATGCATVSPFSNGGSCFACVSYSNTISGFNVSFCVNCLSYSNSGASSHGWSLNANNILLINCVAYGNGGDGFSLNGSGISLVNCLAEGNTGYGFDMFNFGTMEIACAGYNNTAGNELTPGPTHPGELSFVTLSASPFTNAASGDFSLNATTGGGAAVRAAGYPGLFPVGLTTGYEDIGAVQHADPASAPMARMIQMGMGVH